jgi:sortase A
MAQDIADSPDTGAGTPGALEPASVLPAEWPESAEAAASAPVPAEVAPTTMEPTRRMERRVRRSKRRRPWLRWVANLMIIGGVLLLAYPIATWGYTWYEQRQLRQELAETSPGLAAAQAALEAGDLTPAVPPAASTATAGTTPATGVDPAEAERLAQLAAFRAAADKFEAEVGYKTRTPLGRVLIPSIGVDVVMVEGYGKGELREGPGHWPETPFPGQGGNFVVSGHRTTYGAPFRKLNKVQLGDIIDLVLPYGVARYVVTKSVIVYPKEVESVAQLGKEQVSLAACHPIYSARQRIVVQGDLVAFKLVPPVRAAQ